MHLEQPASAAGLNLHCFQKMSFKNSVDPDQLENISWVQWNIVRVFSEVLVAFLYFDNCHLLVANIDIWKSHFNIREGSD